MESTPASEKPRSRRRKAVAIALSAALLIGGLVFYVLRTITNLQAPIICASNLHVIGQAIMEYQNNNLAYSPDSLEALVVQQHLDPNWLICPKSQDSPAEGNTSGELAAALKIPGHISYLYLGKGMKNSVPAETVVAYEPLANHGGEGMHVLFAAGNVEWVSKEDAAKILRSGHGASRPSKD